MAAVGIPKLCQLDQLLHQEASLRQQDRGGLVEASVADSEAHHAVVVDFEEASEATTDLISVEDEVVSDIKVEAALVDEVGMAAVRLTATVMAQHHPLMRLLDLEEEVALVMGMVALLSMVV